VISTGMLKFIIDPAHPLKRGPRQKDDISIEGVDLDRPIGRLDQRDS
jgi:hypothetical protein